MEKQLTEVKVYTGYVQYPHDDVEETDVTACNPKEARHYIETKLATEYEPGGHITRVVERFGWYF